MDGGAGAGAGRRSLTSSSGSRRRVPPAENGHGHDAPPPSRRSSVSLSRGHSASLTSERTVKKLRLSKALTIPDHTTVHEACRRMASRRVDAVLLTDSNALLCGILTDKDITTRVIARELKMEETPVSKVMTRNPVFVLADTLAVEALQKMVQGKFRHLPVVENGEVIAILDIAKCLYDAIARMERAAEKGKAIAAAVEGVEKHWGASVPGPNNFIETLRERMFRPSLSTIISENSKFVTVAPSDTVLTASKKMLELKVSSAAVAIENKPGGILTSRDILMRVIAQNLPPESTTVEEVMTESPDRASVDTPILDAFHIMHDGKFFHLPVLDHDGNVATVVDVLHIAHAAIAMVGNSGAAGSEATSAIMQRFWDSVMSIGPIDDDDYSGSEGSIEVASEATNIGRYIELNILERIVNGSEEPSPLDLALLYSITEDFSEKKKIGTGGCGIVYKGILQNGVVAVKRLHNSRTIKDKMFHREVISLISVKHQNIVRFLGYCSFTKEHAITLGGRTIMADIRERLLCFEYMSNGSLEKHLTDELRGLEWQTRYQIIIGICRGLHYLHKDKGIIHMDLKPGNILLDDFMVPKITDFGLSRPESDSQATTTLLISQGYVAPEYISGGKATSKSDIYSLGVIIIELVTGSRMKPNITKVLRRWNHRWIKSMKQSLLGYQQVAQCLELALRCIQYGPTERPDISDIMNELNEKDTIDGQNQIQISPCCLEDILGIEPLEIHIPFEDLKISHSIELTNDTDDYIAFLTKAKLECFCTEPDRGIVPPRSKCSVTLVMQARVNAQPNVHYTEVITVLSTRVDDGVLATMDLVTAGHIFIDSEEGNKVVDEVNVMVVFGTPELPEE